ncbi:MAG: cytochrome c [Pirellulales bacterium]|nr:cytochrome c [Pirellulales bacterium]
MNRIEDFHPASLDLPAESNSWRRNSVQRSADPRVGNTGRQIRPQCAIGATFLIIAVSFVDSTAANGPHPGEPIYRLLCATCHGANGEGTKNHHPAPLVGDRSLLELTKLIEETMPEDAPEKCVGEDAKNVASYVYDSFYSPLAQMRNRPARIELSPPCLSRV